MCHVFPGGVLCEVATWAFGGGPYINQFENGFLVEAEMIFFLMNFCLENLAFK